MTSARLTAPSTPHSCVRGRSARSSPPSRCGWRTFRQPALADLGLSPGQLTTAGAIHYPCTGRWAAALHSAQFDGVWWHSRQASLYDEARQSGGLAEVLLTHAAIEVGVIWAHPAAPGCLRVGEGVSTLLYHGEPDRLVLELAALLGLVVETG